MTRERDYERPDDWFAAQFDDHDAGAVDAGADDPAVDAAGADDAAREFTWGLRPSGDMTSAAAPPPPPRPEPEREHEAEHEPEAEPFDASLVGAPSIAPEPPVDGLPSGSAADPPSVNEVLSSPSPRRAAREAAASEVAAREAAASEVAAREQASREVDPRRFIERTGEAPSGTGDHQRIAATPVSPGVVPPAALLTPEASGLEALFGTSGNDLTGPVLIPRKRRAEGTTTSRPTRAAPAGVTKKRRFTSNQVVIASIALLAVLLVVIVVFALVRAGTQDVSPDVESLQIGELIPGIVR